MPVRGQPSFEWESIGLESAGDRQQELRWPSFQSVDKVLSAKMRHHGSDPSLQVNTDLISILRLYLNTYIHIPPDLVYALCGELSTNKNVNPTTETKYI
jgi:hypothetical protein